MIVVGEIVSEVVAEIIVGMRVVVPGVALGLRFAGGFPALRSGRGGLLPFFPLPAGNLNQCPAFALGPLAGHFRFDFVILEALGAFNGDH